MGGSTALFGYPEPAPCDQGNIHRRIGATTSGQAEAATEVRLEDWPGMAPGEPGERRGEPAAVAYDWSSWAGFLLPSLLPRVTRLPAVLGEGGRDILARLPRADLSLFFFHIDLTDTRRCPPDRPQLCQALRSRGYVPVNAHAGRAGKRDVQRTCVEAGLLSTVAARAGDPDELLIRKTDRNYGGEPETRLSEETRKRLGVEALPCDRQLDHGYRVCRRAAIAEFDWADPNFVVERYVDNTEHLFYRAFVMGRRVVLLEGVSQEPVRAVRRSERRGRFFFELTSAAVDVPEAILPSVITVGTFCATFRLDFGCLDLVRDDHDRFYVIDLNLTPWGTRNETGLEDYLLLGAQELLATLDDG